MGLEIECPNCGRRPVEEFLYGEVPVVPDSIEGPDARDLDRAFMHENAEDLVIERWFHAYGCRRWTTVRRDTRTDEVLGHAPAPGYSGGHRPARKSGDRLPISQSR